MNRKFLVMEGQLAMLKMKSLSERNRKQVTSTIAKQEITNQQAERDQYVFVLTKKEIEAMLKMAKKKKDNLFVWVRGYSLGYVTKIKPQGDCYYSKMDKDWKDISDFQNKYK